MLQLASNREPPQTSAVGPIFPHNFARRIIFAILLTLLSRKTSSISKNRKDFVDVEFEILQILYRFYNLHLRILYIFSMSNGFQDIKKKVFEKSLSGVRGCKNLDLGTNTFKIFVLTGNRDSLQDSTVGAIFPPKLGVGVFLEIIRTLVSQTWLEISKCARQIILK